ncbi:MAG: hypothetical protein HQ475_10555 [SAR202 cluster bacterium]|nr:hypothetical protein [SAR202 cluster bacterium]
MFGSRRRRVQRIGCCCYASGNFDSHAYSDDEFWCDAIAHGYGFTNRHDWADCNGSSDSN